MSASRRRPTNIRVEGPEYEPTGRAWKQAGSAARRRYWEEVGRIALQVRRRSLVAGLDKDGHDFLPVKRTWGAKPLSPHRGASRTVDRMRARATAGHATLYWTAGWAKILGHHAYRQGPRALPVRDVFGLPPEDRRAIARRARAWWRRDRPRPRPEAPRPRRAAEGLWGFVGRLARGVIRGR